MSADTWGAAFQRFVDALNRPRDAEALRAAVTDDIHIDRHRPGERGVAPVVESFTGFATVARWVALTPAVARFTLAGVAWPDRDGERDGTWGIEYAISTGEFHNGGLWIARLSDDGRIAFLSHHPFALSEEG